MGDHLNLFSKKTEIYQAGQVSVRKHHAGGQEGQKTGETQSKPLVKLIRGMKAVIKLSNRLLYDRLEK